MPRGYPLLTSKQKGGIISRIKEKGERVADLAREYGVQQRNIFGYLSRSGQNSNTLRVELKKKLKPILVRKYFSQPELVSVR